MLRVAPWHGALRIATAGSRRNVSSTHKRALAARPSLTLSKLPDRRELRHEHRQLALHDGDLLLVAHAAARFLGALERLVRLSLRPDRGRGSLCRRACRPGAKESPWTRWEVELRNVDRVIPWDVIPNPAPYIAGAYPALSWLNGLGCRIPTLRRTDSISYQRIIFYARIAYESRHSDQQSAGP